MDNKTETGSQTQKVNWWLSEGKGLGRLDERGKGLRSTN